MKHKYAEILTACINKENIQVFQRGVWTDIGEHAVFAAALNDGAKCSNALQPEDFRVKPKTIMIGKHEVEAPISVAPAEKSLCFAVSTENINCYYSVVWLNDEIDFRYLRRGILHMTKEAAIEHAKALLSFTQAKE